MANNFSVCRDHYRLTLRLPQFSEAVPGQFLHIGPPAATPHEYRTLMTKRDTVSPEWLVECTSPMLRRAFSIAGLRRKGAETDVDIIYRVVGTATRWLESRHPGDVVSVCGPLGRGFQIPEQRSQAWVVAGGVGLPPMIWLCEALRAAGKQAVAFCGAQTRQLLPLTMTAPEPDTGARTATLSAAEFSSHGVPVVISTDDGTLGFAGNIGQALDRLSHRQPSRIRRSDSLRLRSGAYAPVCGRLLQHAWNRVFRMPGTGHGVRHRNVSILRRAHPGGRRIALPALLPGRAGVSRRGSNLGVTCRRGSLCSEITGLNRAGAVSDK